MSTDRSQTKASPFVRALRQLAESQGTITNAEINKLTAASNQDISDFQREWPRIAVERQRAIVSAMNDASELSVQLDFTELFIALLDDADEFVRAGAVDGLWENDRPGVGRRLLRMLTDDRSALVRAAAAEGLGHFLERAENGRPVGPSAAAMTESLLTRFNDAGEELEVRRRALESVSFSSDERVHDVIAEAYDEGDDSLRVSAVFAMGRSLDQSWTDIVQRELTSRDPAMRYEAVIAAGELMIVDALPSIISLVEADDDIEVRQSAVWALGQIGGNEARRVLEGVLEGDEETLHEVAEDALAELEFAEGVTRFNMFEFDADDSSTGNGHVDGDTDEDDDEEE